MTVATVLFTCLAGRLVGRDEMGNRYYAERRPKAGRMERRWVLYAGKDEGSSVTPAWHGWLHHTLDAPLDLSDAPSWVKPHQPNQTGTEGAYHPPGDPRHGGTRPHATGDYESWRP